MVIAVLANETSRPEFLSKTAGDQATVIWVDSVRSLEMVEADAFFDLLFEYDPERIRRLSRLLPKPVFVASVIFTVRDIQQPFIRINDWPTMLGRSLTEVSANAQSGNSLKTVFDALGWQYQIVPDIVGMVTPRIVSMIINEAWFTLGDGVSSKEQIDTAMRLGTNYPFGPFEWAEKIGYDRIKELLRQLSKTDSRYTIAPALLNHQ